MEITFRPVKPEEIDAFLRAASRGFSDDFPDEASHPDAIRIARSLFEHERSFAAFDGAEIAGTCSSASFRMTVPGGAAVPTAGVTYVTVQPTHRRRGILTGMMQRQLRDIKERGEPLAALWASESAIYGRFGYGMAVQHERWSIDSRHAQFAHGPGQSGQVRFVDRDEAARIYPGYT